MAKIFILVAAIIAIALAAPSEKRKVSLKKFFEQRMPFREPAPFDGPIPANVTLLTVTQRVDNFNPANLDTWQQRYFMNNEFYRPGSPIFVFLGGESAINEQRLTSSHMYDIARDLNANLFHLEHRFYGESRPTENVSDANLRFLTVEQALADTAHFINHIQSTVEGAANAQFILVGAHYSASLAVWFRQQYPHLVRGVWASSAPLPSIVDFDQYKVAIGAAFRRLGGDSCYNALEAGFSSTLEMIEAEEWEELSEYFRLCWDLGPDDVPHFFGIMGEFYGLLPITATEASIRGTCALLQGPGHPVANVAAILNFFFAPDECLVIDHAYIIEAERQIEWDAPAVVVGDRQWSYQMCSSIGWFHTSGAFPDQPFGDAFPVEIYHETCEEIFGASFTPDRLERNSNRFNTFYGGLTPQITNAVFVYGQHDPWNVIGRTTDLNDDAVSIVIAGGTQGNDLPPIRDNDSAAVVAAKRRIQELIEGWLA
ncbi:putative serine protease K12H4.7 isoform X2 [Bradysia coprophila]|nr:putative serine protease K12H4.7 isoform X2 [Bradysia coprophila]